MTPHLGILNNSKMEKSGEAIHSNSTKANFIYWIGCLQNDIEVRKEENNDEKNIFFIFQFLYFKYSTFLTSQYWWTWLLLAWKIEGVVKTMLQRKLQGITCWLIHGDVQWVCGNRGATCKTINFKSSDHSYILETRQKFKLCPSHPCLYPEVTAGDYSPTIFFQEPVST